MATKKLKCHWNMSCTNDGYGTIEFVTVAGIKKFVVCQACASGLGWSVTPLKESK